MTTSKNLKVSAIICAAGRGERAGFLKNKLLVPLYGAPVLRHTLEKFDIDCIDEVIITSSKNDFAEICAIAAPFGAKVVLGGETRTDSVRAALFHVTGDIVLIHDGARPFVKREHIIDCIDSVIRFGSGICALPVTDTVAFSNYGIITDMPDRSSLYAVQTPQGFFTEDIRRAYELCGDKKYTDDSAVYGEFIAFPRVVEGSPDNVKLTYMRDFMRGIPLISTISNGRCGFGADVHPFGEGEYVTLAGVKIPCDRGLVAHSDGDVIIHALMDALLSAAGMNDIGHFFPDSDPSYAGADSRTLLETVLDYVHEKGYAPANISISVQAEKPRLSPHIDKMAANIARLTCLNRYEVAISAGTCEGLGFVGQGLGIAAYANVMLKETKNG